MKRPRKNDNYSDYSAENQLNAERGNAAFDLSGLEQSTPQIELTESHLDTPEQAIIAEQQERLENAIERTGEKSFRLSKFSMTTTSLEIPEDTDENELSFLGQWLSGLETASNWWRGKWANFQTRHITGESDEANQQRNDLYQSLAVRFGMNDKTLRNCAYVERKVTPSRRRDDLSFSHHAEVAGLDPKQQDYYLRLASELSLSVAKLRTQIREDNSPKDEKTTESKQMKAAHQFVERIKINDLKQMKKVERRKVYELLKPYIEALQGEFD